MKVVIVNCFDTYEHRVDLLVDFLLKRNDSVTVYTSDYMHIKKARRLDKKENFVYIPAQPYQKNLSVRRLLSHKKLARDIFKRLGKQRIDFMWVILPPNSFAKEAVKYKKSHQGTKLVFDIIDMWPETLPLRKTENLFPIKKWESLRDNSLAKAEYVVTECRLYQKELKRTYRGKIKTLYLAREQKPFAGRAALPESKFSLCYLGSINNIVDIGTIREVIRRFADKAPTELHIIGDGEKRNELIQACKMRQVKVTYHGLIYDREKKQKIFDKCHYGLNIMKESVFVGLTMKSVDYFEAGLPIINNIRGDTWDIIEKYHAGVNFQKNRAENLAEVYDQDMRVNARRFFETNLTTHIFENKMEKIYQEVMEK